MNELVKSIVIKSHAEINKSSAHLTELDQAIGDGDHGINMKRGFDGILEVLPELENMPFGDALQKAGMTLVLKVGGASGPLFGSFLMEMGKVQREVPQNSQQLADLVSAGISAVKSRGKSDVGAKTMLDVLVPVQEAIASIGTTTAARMAADISVEETKNIKATKGRAAFLGERSIGHVDPGAKSIGLLVHCICDVLEEK